MAVTNRWAIDSGVSPTRTRRLRVANGDTAGTVAAHSVVSVHRNLA
jgi:hypothetical protein